MKMILTYILKDLGYVVICTLPLAFYNTKETYTYIRLLPETNGIRLEYNRTRTEKNPFHFNERKLQAKPRQLPPVPNNKAT